MFEADIANVEETITRVYFDKNCSVIISSLGLHDVSSTSLNWGNMGFILCDVFMVIYIVKIVKHMDT